MCPANTSVFSILTPPHRPPLSPFARLPPHFSSPNSSRLGGLSSSLMLAFQAGLGAGSGGPGRPGLGGGGGGVCVGGGGGKVAGSGRVRAAAPPRAAQSPAAAAAPLIHGPRPPDSGKCGETKPLSQSDSQQLSPRDKDALGLDGLLNSCCPARDGERPRAGHPRDADPPAWARRSSGPAVAGPTSALRSRRAHMRLVAELPGPASLSQRACSGRRAGGHLTSLVAPPARAFSPFSISSFGSLHQCTCWNLLTLLSLH